MIACKKNIHYSLETPMNKTNVSILNSMDMMVVEKDEF